MAELAESRAGLYEKKCKTLKKRLRQIQQLQDKMDKGEKLIPEQLEKLASRSAAEKELADLEAAFSGITISSLVDTIKQR